MPPRPAAAAQSGATPAMARATVLLVEDNVLVGLAAAEMLENLGYVVHRVTSGAKALARLQADDRIAAMVADVGLPDMNGHQLAARARARTPGLRVLFITGYDSEAPGRTPPDAITAYLEKPYQAATLGAALQTLLVA